MSTATNTKKRPPLPGHHMVLGETEKRVQQRLREGQPTWVNPTERRGKRLWYSGSIGTEPFIAEVILERVREAAER